MSDVFDELEKRLEEKAKFGSDIKQAILNTWRCYELQNALELEEWVRLEDVKRLLQEIREKYVLVSKEKLEEVYKNLEIDKISGYYVNLEFFRMIEELLRKNE